MRRPMRGIRARLTVTLLALVALTAAVLGVGSYLFVDYRLHEQARDDAAAEARFDLSVVIPDRLPDQPTIDDIVASRLGDTFHQRVGRDRRRSRAGRSVRLEHRPRSRARPAPGGPEAPRRRGRARLRLDRARPDAPRSSSAAASCRPARTSTSSTTYHALEATLGQLRLALGGGALALVLVAAAGRPVGRARRPLAGQGGRAARPSGSNAATSRPASR